MKIFWLLNNFLIGHCAKLNTSAQSCKILVKKGRISLNPNEAVDYLINITRNFCRKRDSLKPIIHDIVITVGGQEHPALGILPQKKENVFTKVTKTSGSIFSVGPEKFKAEGFNEGARLQKTRVFG